ncbi:uncharacterized protein K444DRAFT_356821 [Hyaloscypha bicolor E]|uniref:Uncharacterized protein n=1 Tax=Hyaloscypha bicolor E TaxID=1095630 RepID=A0A2J6TJ71_9HELO|nr:uncharacterized protein K444DRAFT_356821 [Hyaloscypha bicolor E]PMD63053.1 hypothetical protein K444DRAFT_356821 [Hyaloscypha bicolor E]
MTHWIWLEEPQVLSTEQIGFRSTHVGEAWRPIRDFSASVSQRPSRLAERKGYSTSGSTVSWRWLHAAVSTAKEDVISMLQTRGRFDDSSRRNTRDFRVPPPNNKIRAGACLMSRQREASEGGHCHALTLLPQTRHRMGWDGFRNTVLCRVTDPYTAPLGTRTAHSLRARAWGCYTTAIAAHGLMPLHDHSRHPMAKGRRQAVSLFPHLPQPGPAHVMFIHYSRMA